MSIAPPEWSCAPPPPSSFILSKISVKRLRSKNLFFCAADIWKILINVSRGHQRSASQFTLIKPNKLPMSVNCDARTFSCTNTANLVHISFAFCWYEQIGQVDLWWPLDLLWVFFYLSTKNKTVLTPYFLRLFVNMDWLVDLSWLPETFINTSKRTAAQTKNFAAQTFDKHSKNNLNNILFCQRGSGKDRLTFGDLWIYLFFLRNYSATNKIVLQQKSSTNWLTPCFLWFFFFHKHWLAGWPFMTSRNI